MTIWLIKDDNGHFHPYQDEDREKANKIKPMEEFLVTTKKLRDPVSHRRYMALIKISFENQDFYTDVNVFRKVIEMESGYFIPVKKPDGTIMELPDSIAYERLDEYEFREVYRRIWQTVHDKYGYDNELFEAEIMRMI